MVYNKPVIHHISWMTYQTLVQVSLVDNEYMFSYIIIHQTNLKATEARIELASVSFRVKQDYQQPILCNKWEREESNLGSTAYETSQGTIPYYNSEYQSRESNPIATPYESVPRTLL